MGWGTVRSRARRCALIVGLLFVGTTATAEARTAAPAVPAAPSGVAAVDTPDLAAKGWQPVFADEFNTLDENTWHVIENDSSRRDAVTVEPTHGGQSSSGFLRLRTYTENGRHYNGGILTDQNDRTPHGLFNFTYGYMEARIKFDNKAGTTSDLWSLSAQGNRGLSDPGESGPETGFEHINPDNDTTATCGVTEQCNKQPVGILGWDGYREDDHAVGEHVPNPNPSGPVLQGNFHTYGLLWSPEGWRYFIDGKQVFETTEGMTYRPQFLLMTQQVHGGWAGPTPADYGGLGTTNNQTYVDYIKVWQRPISEVPNQVIGVNQAQAVPFGVTDNFYANPGKAEPDSVRVTASSSNTTLLPNANIAISGNGPSAPAGDLTNASFDNAFTPDDWITAGSASASTTRYKTAPGGLRLETAGGTASQTVTGLQPNTTYALGGWFDIEIDWNDDGDGVLEWTDTDEDGLYDVKKENNQFVYTETGETLIDTEASVDWGVRDPATDALVMSGRLERNYWTLGKNAYIPDYLTFTTGPGQTSAKLFVSNQAYASGGADSKVSVDDLYLRPIVPPERTVTVRPADGQSGTVDVTLTARDENNTVLGTDTFAVKVLRDNFVNGGFDAMPEGKGWELWYGDSNKRLGLEVVVDDPFSLNRVLKLGQAQIVDPRGTGQPGNHPGATGTAFNRVSGLQPNAQYKLTVKGKGSLAFGVQGYAGTTNPCAVAGSCEITTPDWSPKEITFTTNAQGTATLVLADWYPNTGAQSYVDEVTLEPVTPVAPTAVAAPGLTSLSEQRLPSSAPAAIRFTRPSGTTITGVSSDNQTLLPNNNLALAGTGSQRVLSLTPVRDRTGTATVTVTYTGGSKTIPIVVTDEALEAASFEGETTAWMLSQTGATIAAGNQRSGASSLSVQGAGTATQRLLAHNQWGENGLFDWNRGYILSGYGRDGATVTVTERRPSCPTQQPGQPPVAGQPCGNKVLGTYTWTGAALAYGEVKFSTGMDDCQGCRGQQAVLEIVVTDGNGGPAAYLDDLSFMHGPHLSAIRDVSLFTGQTQTDWEGRTSFRTGRIPIGTSNTDPNMTITSSNPSVVPLANIKPERDPRNPLTWSLLITAPPGTPTGTSEVTVKLTDPRTLATVQRSFTVTVSSGDFNNGAFQRGNADWVAAWVIPPNNLPKWNTVERNTSLRPTDFDTVMKMDQGVATYQVENLVPGATYVLSGRMIGDGGTVTVRRGPINCICNLADPVTTNPVTVNTTTWQPFSLTFTVPTTGVGTEPPGDLPTDVWISLENFTYGEADLGFNPCVDHPSVTAPTGRTCFDDLMIVPAP